MKRKTRFSDTSASPFGLLSSETIGSNEVSLTKRKLSDNVVVRDMFLEIPPSKLSFEDTNTYANILESVANQLELIEYVIPWNISESTEKIGEKYDFETVGDLESGSDLRKAKFLNSGPSVAEKLQRDRTYIFNILSVVIQELRSKRTFESLQREVNNIAKSSEAHHDLEINYEVGIEQLKQLSELIDYEKSQTELKKKKLLESINNSTSNVENVVFRAISNLDYIKKWEEARLEQQKLRLEIEELVLQEKLSDCARMGRVDDVVSAELRVFFQNDVAKMNNDIESWLAYYKADLEKYDRNIENLNEKIKDELNTLELKYTIRDKRNMLIDQCATEKLELAKKIEHEKAICRAATIIQALWRGHMVRNQLGQYKGLVESLRRRTKKRKKMIRKKFKNQRKKLPSF